MEYKEGSLVYHKYLGKAIVFEDMGKTVLIKFSNNEIKCVHKRILKLDNNSPKIFTFQDIKEALEINKKINKSTKKDILLYLFIKLEE